MKIPGRDDAGVDILQLVCTWLRHHQKDKWLLVIDNADHSVVFSDGPKEELAVELGTVYDSASPISKFIPETRNGFVLITSRSKTVARRLTGDTTTVLPVEPMPLDEARTLLHIHLAADGNVKDVDQLLETLSHIPLALKQAAAYINRHAPRMTVKKYLQELLRGGSAQAELLYQGFSDVHRDPNPAKSIGQTWQLVLYHIRDMAPSSIHLLSLASLFDPDGIHKDLLMHYDDDPTDNLGYQHKRDVRFDKDISILKSYFFIMTNERGDSVVMHRLVQSWLKDWLQRDFELEEWKVKFLSILSMAFPGDPYEDLAKCKSLFPHAVFAIDYRPADVNHLELYATVLEKVSSYARAIGNYKVAEAMSEAAFRCSKEWPGAGASLILDRALNLASILEAQGKFEPATDLIQHLYEERIESLGRHHPDTLACAVAFSSVLVPQARSDESLAFIEGLLKECESALGPKHPDTLLIMSAVSSVYEGMGQVDKAIALQKAVVESVKATMGVEHPATASAMEELAGILLFSKHSSEEAERLERRVSSIRQRVLGSEHPDTLSAMPHLAAIIYAQNRSKEAESLERRVFSIRRRVLGSEHPDTLSAMAHLAAIMYAQNMSEEAESLETQVTLIREKVLGPDHPDIRLVKSHVTSRDDWFTPAGLSNSNLRHYQRHRELWMRLVNRQMQLADEKPLERSETVFKEQQSETKRATPHLAKVNPLETMGDLQFTASGRLRSSTLTPFPRPAH